MIFIIVILKQIRHTQSLYNFIPVFILHIYEKLIFFQSKTIYDKIFIRYFLDLHIQLILILF